MKKPDFFILGAPKCGTTSMDAWLRGHPLVFMAHKESHYFNTDHKNRKTGNPDDYHALFASATDRHRAVGECSVRYLYSADAVANILAYAPDAKFIVMLRNPIDMARACHNHAYLHDVEDVRDFAAAWHLQEKREAGECVPGGCAEVKMLYYGKVCLLGEQLQRLYARVPAARVHVVFFDDLRCNPGRAYRSVLDFLGVPDDRRREFTARNPAQTFRLHFLKYALPYLGKIKTKLGVRRGFGILEYVRGKNIKVQNRAPLSPRMRRTLIRYFAHDVALLERLTGRNLRHWVE